MIRVNGSIQLDEGELREKFARASGPGGQNVNKVETKVLLRFDVLGSPNLPEEVKTRLLALAGSRATASGEVVVEAERFRTREENRADARERLLELIRRAARRPRPRTATRPTRASKERRLKKKRTRADVKRGRGRVSGEE